MPQSDYNIDALIGKINALERKISEGIKVEISKSAPQPQMEKSVQKEKTATFEKIETPSVKIEPENKPKNVLLADDVGENPFEAPPKKAEEAVLTLFFFNIGAAEIFFQFAHCLFVIRFAARSETHFIIGYAELKKYIGNKFCVVCAVY